MPNVAVIVRFEFRTNEHVRIVLPVHGPPLQPRNCPVKGVSISVMLVLAGKVAVHVVPQLIPAGLLVTLPVPLF